MSQAWATPFYRSEAWQRCREAYLKTVAGLCEDCLEAGLYTPAKVVHHIRHITPENINDPQITLDFQNLRAVCQDCHAREHKKSAQSRYFIDVNGNVHEKRPPLCLIDMAVMKTGEKGLEKHKAREADLSRAGADEYADS